jgi:hypothetical protein
MATQGRKGEEETIKMISRKMYPSMEAQERRNRFDHDKSSGVLVRQALL